MINFSLNTCWRLIPTNKSKVVEFINHLFFFTFLPLKGCAVAGAKPLRSSVEASTAGADSACAVR